MANQAVAPSRLSQDRIVPGNTSPEKIARIKPTHSRPTKWAPTTDKDESHPDGAKTQR